MKSVIYILSDFLKLFIYMESKNEISNLRINFLFWI